MIKTKATIKVLDPMEEGVNKATGNAWQSQSVVLELSDLDGKTHTIAAKTMKSDVIKTLSEATIGMEVEAGLQYQANAREWTNKEGKKCIFRGTDVFLFEVKLLEF